MESKRKFDPKKIIQNLAIKKETLKSLSPGDREIIELAVTNHLYGWHIVDDEVKT